MLIEGVRGLVVFDVIMRDLDVNTGFTAGRELARVFRRCLAEYSFLGMNRIYEMCALQKCTKHRAAFQGALCHVRARLHVADLAMRAFEVSGVLTWHWGIDALDRV